ncbi:hypothetical protein UPYG_G00024470 [Umbra pygmaea]|uniref:ADP-ribosylation factor-like protein 11 n=1 Tax=Umbra pygmaea TaxID=75934 RepID=A0ABD0XLL8_UMBPY
MGLFFCKSYMKKNPTVILMGLESSGKSTLLYRLHTGMVMETSPTVGFNVVTLNLENNIALTVWDVGGQSKMRANWKYYLEGCKALVFVVDSSDLTRIREAQKALKMVLSDENMKGVPLTVLANKQDLPNSMNIRELSNQLDLPSYKHQAWEIQACSGLKGLGLHQAFLSVAKQIKS